LGGKGKKAGLLSRGLKRRELHLYDDKGETHWRVPRLSLLLG